MRERSGHERAPVVWRLFPWLAFLVLATAKIVAFLPSAIGYSSDDEKIYLDMARVLAEGRLYSNTHFPPLHPLALSPATWFDDPYRAGIVLVALYSSALVIPVWLLARELLGVKHAAVVASLSCLLPFHYTLSRTLLSETTYYPLLILAIYMVITTRWRNLTARDMLTGAIVGALVLSRYMTLVFIPGLALAWLLRERVRTGRWLPDADAWRRILLVCLLAALVLAPWVAGQMRNGAPFAETLGSDVGGGTRYYPEQLTGSALVRYAALYIATWMVWLAPILGVLLLAIARLRRAGLTEPLSRLTLTALAMVLPLWAVVTRHSWRVPYNWPSPLRIMDRYCIYIVMLAITIAYATSVLSPRERRLHPVLHWALGAAIPLIALPVAYWLVFAWGYVPAPLTTVPTVTAGDTFRVFAMGSWFWPIAGTSVLALAWLLWRRDERAPLAVAIALVVFLSTGAPTTLAGLSTPQAFKTHALELAPVVTEYYSELDLCSVAVSADVVDESGLTARQLTRGIAPNLRLHGTISVKTGQITDPEFRYAHIFVFTANEYQGPGLDTYEIGDDTYVYVLH